MTFREAVVDDVLGESVAAARYERLAEAAMVVPTDGIGGWRFCHPLIHDAAYRSLLATRSGHPPHPRGRSPGGTRARRADLRLWPATGSRPAMRGGRSRCSSGQRTRRSSSARRPRGGLSRHGGGARDGPGSGLDLPTARRRGARDRARQLIDGTGRGSAAGSARASAASTSIRRPG